MWVDALYLVAKPVSFPLQHLPHGASQSQPLAVTSLMHSGYKAGRQGE